MDRLPARAAAFHDPGFDVVPRRKGGESFFRDDSGKTRQRAAHQKRPLLPITAQKVARRQAAEQL
jgi:hypothetical protein